MIADSKKTRVYMIFFKGVPTMVTKFTYLTDSILKYHYCNLLMFIMI
jgi:hypothetical protein